MPRLSAPYVAVLATLSVLTFACSTEPPPSPMSGSPVSQAAPSAPSAPSASAVDVRAMSIEDLASEYRRLRLVKGHFSVPPGKWVDEVDSSGGRKEAVMRELERRLRSGTTRARLVALLGEPDRIVREGQESDRIVREGTEFRPSTKQASLGHVDEPLVYEWRGMHDFLFFTVDGSEVTGSGWWGAGA